MVDLMILDRNFTHQACRARSLNKRRATARGGQFWRTGSSRNLFGEIGCKLLAQQLVGVNIVGAQCVCHRV
jgi:hypothetical protein